MEMIRSSARGPDSAVATDRPARKSFRYPPENQQQPTVMRGHGVVGHSTAAVMRSGRTPRPASVGKPEFPGPEIPNTTKRRTRAQPSGLVLTKIWPTQIDLLGLFLGSESL